MATEGFWAMITDGALVLGIISGVLLLIWAARGKARGAPRDPLEDARELIARQIDEHIEALAQEYLADDQRVCRPGTDRFGQEIERFIGDVLLRRAERSEPWLKEALREILVLQRDDVYGEVRKRVEAHLRQSFAE